MAKKKDSRTQVGEIKSNLEIEEFVSKNRYAFGLLLWANMYKIAITKELNEEGNIVLTIEDCKRARCMVLADAVTPENLRDAQEIHDKALAKAQERLKELSNPK